MITAPRPLSGSPEQAEAMAGQLGLEAERLTATARVLRGLSGQAHAAWDSPAGDRFAAAAGHVAAVLDRVATRYAGSASAVRGLAAALREAQAITVAAIAEHEAWLPVFLRQGDLMATAQGSPDPSVVATAEAHRALMVAAGDRLDAAHRAASRARAAWEEADLACAGVLARLSADGLADSAAYNALTGVADTTAELGQFVDLLGPARLVPLPPLKAADALGSAADLVSVVADSAVLACYGDGDPGALATRAGIASLAPLGSVLKKTGTITGEVRRGATRARPGTRAYVKATRPLTVGERWSHGLRQGLADTFGSASHRPPTHPVAWTRAPRGLRASGTWARQQASARATAWARSAWLDDFERAVANGVGARRTFVAGTGAKVAARGLDPLAQRPPAR